jgi:hypothetical protein
MISFNNSIIAQNDFKSTLELKSLYPGRDEYPAIAAFLDSNDFVAIRLSEGLGKTEFILKYLASVKASYLILVETVNVSLCEKTKNDFIAAGFDTTLYSENPLEMGDVHISSIDSLPKATKLVREKQQATGKKLIVFIDESRHVQTHLTKSKTLADNNKRGRSLSAQAGFASHCDKLIIADAHKDDGGTQDIIYYQDLSGKQPSLLYSNQYHKVEIEVRTLAKGDMPAAALEVAEEVRAAGQRIAQVSDTKLSVENIVPLLNDRGINARAITSSTKTQDYAAHFLKDTDKNFPTDWDVFCSPTMGDGHSIMENFTGVVIACHSGSTYELPSLIQHFKRFRLASKIIILFAAKPKQLLDNEDLMKMGYKKAFDLQVQQHLTKYGSEALVEITEALTTGKMSYTGTPTQIAHFNYLNRLDLSKAIYFQNPLKHALEALKPYALGEIKVTEFVSSKEDRKELKEEIAANRQVIEAEEVALTLAARKISPEEYKSLKKDEFIVDPTDEEKWQCEQYKVRGYFTDDNVLTEQNILDYRSHELLRSRDLYTALNPEKLVIDNAMSTSINDLDSKSSLKRLLADNGFMDLLHRVLTEGGFNEENHDTRQDIQQELTCNIGQNLDFYVTLLKLSVGKKESQVAFISRVAKGLFSMFGVEFKSKLKRVKVAGEPKPKPTKVMYTNQANLDRVNALLVETTKAQAPKQPRQANKDVASELYYSPEQEALEKEIDAIDWSIPASADDYDLVPF